MFEPAFIIAAASLIGLCVVAFAMLKGWQDWLALKQRELDSHAHEVEGGVGVGAARIEIADLKERIKKLEAIASGVDL
ncbi:hypothetical protein P7228_01890 [Altererythrobacter arenosus]|uniref:Phage-shock protein n=1 Tax=Altererythrobacter arenosus TaxID=3032592 RepID=A0ABY8FUC6_9SPHN|nr:hypothetical protein [Altererythrobacter sp. CAU 1644]WFL77845.1 hypothetical protein P7228_01890 [Altererythrobacter sp. CAU 1644]